jgi:superfamily II DNA or RNA helicase
LLVPLHDYQQVAHEHAVTTLRAAGKQLYVAPTGSGKSYILAANHSVMYDSMLTVVPSTEIGIGVYERLAVAVAGVRSMSEGKAQEECERVGVWTVMRLYNELMSGHITPPKFLQFDEAHHTTANTYEAVHALCGDCPAVAYTATGFRGTPEETAKLRAKWGEPYVVLTLKKAVERGAVARPDFRVWPLLNDETIKVTNGEFEVKAVEGRLKDVAADLVWRIGDELFDTDAYRWFRPTMLTVPGVASANHMAELFRTANLPAAVVIGETRDRQAIFRDVVECRKLLIQVNVVSEGVDLPIRVHVDTAPCMSPVRWMQRIGRGTRPVGADECPLYICTNHNLTRHAYLWAGVIPSAQIRDAQKAWGPDFKPSRRTFARAIGLEGFGKFAASQVPLLDGSYLGLYALQTPNGTHQYAVLLHPCRADPLFFERANPYTNETASFKLPDGRTVEYKKKDYGPWKRIKSIPNADGYLSTKVGAVTDPMLDWWRRAAEGRGLDPTFVPNAREFQALPILCNTGIRFKLEEN